MNTYIRALRLPFITASVIPFIAGSFIQKQNFNLLYFILGLITVISTHLGANLINDYADSKSGADWKDRHFYQFFGGSKLIQEGVLSEKFYFNLACIFFITAMISVVVLAYFFQSALVIFCYLAVLFLGFSYSHVPLRLSYRKMGEIVIFLLFGPAVVIGANFIQTQVILSLKSLILSLPFGFLTAAILFSNEVPDYDSDIQANKLNLVHMVTPVNAYLVYALLVVCAYLSLIWGIRLKYLSSISLFSFLLLPLPLRAIVVLKRFYSDKMRLIESSKITIALQALIGTIILVDILI